MKLAHDRACDECSSLVTAAALFETSETDYLVLCARCLIYAAENALSAANFKADVLHAAHLDLQEEPHYLGPATYSKAPIRTAGGPASTPAQPGQQDEHLIDGDNSAWDNLVV